MMQQEQTDEENGQQPVPYTIRLLPITVQRLKMLEMVYGISLGQLVNQMVAINYRHMSRVGGKLDGFIGRLQEGISEE